MQIYMQIMYKLHYTSLGTEKGLFQIPQNNQLNGVRRRDGQFPECTRE